MNNTELTSKVWESIKGSAAKAKKFEDTVAVSFSLLSEDNEDIYVVVKDGKMSVEPYHYDDNNCEVEASAEIIEKMFSGEISFDKALNDGMIQIKSGDAAKLKALECLVPSKKSAAKSAKTETKSAAKTETKTAAKASAKEETKSAAKTETKAAAKTEAKPEAKEEVKPAAKTEAKPAAKPAAKSAGNAKKSAKKK